MCVHVKNGLTFFLKLISYEREYITHIYVSLLNLNTQNKIIIKLSIYYNLLLIVNFTLFFFASILFNVKP